MENLADLMKKQQDSEAKALDYSIEHCEECNEPTQKIVKLFGRETKVRVICSCRKKERLCLYGETRHFV